MTIAESMDKLRAVMQVAERAKVPVACGVSTSFGCPFEGDVPVQQVESVVRRLIDMGARAIGLADTTAWRTVQVGAVLEHLMPKFPGIDWTLHTHDTRAMAIRTSWPRWSSATPPRLLDRRSGRLPFAPGASGNVCSEDLVHCLHAMGVETGIDLDRLIAVSRRVQDIIGRALPSARSSRRKSTRRYPVPDTVAARVSAARA